MNAGESTAKYTISTRLIEQVIGQERAVEIVRLAAQQRRFLLLIGEPGTGKSLLGRAVAELLPKASPACVVALANAEQLSCPRIARLEPQTLTQLSLQAEQNGVWQQRSHNFLLAAAALALVLVCLWWTYREKAAIYLAFAGLGLFLLWQQRRQSGLQKTWDGPKVLYQSLGDQAPFIDATGCSEGALFGDVRHDPYQSGGRESPPHQLIEVGAVHRAHGGVLYIDEIASLSFRSQRLLLTAIQDKALPITGRQRGSSGTLVQTEAVPCDFVLVAAGNPEDLKKLSPALRSRLIGYGYEVLTQATMSDDLQHHEALGRFIAQEVSKDGRIPHFSAEAVAAVIEQARARAREAGRLTSRLRELGGLIRVAGDLAMRKGLSLVTADEVLEALNYAKSIEQQGDETSSRQEL